MRKVVGRVDAPGRARAMVGFLQDAVRDNVPHDRVRVDHVLLHPQRHLARLVHAVAHRLKLAQGLLDRLRAVLRVRARAVLLPTPLVRDVLRCGRLA